MSLSFTNIVSQIDANLDTSSTTYPLATKVLDINLALDNIFSLIFKASGKWQFDDSNHSDFPFITTDLVANQRDYTFTSDGSGNLILDVYKVMVKDESGIFHEIYPVDQQSDENMDSFFDGQNTSGIPSRYDKTGNGILLDVIPSYNSTGGLKVFINREGSYFTVASTTTKPGFAGIFHEYLALRPSYYYAFRKGYKNADRFKMEMVAMESKIKSYYRDRSRDEQSVLTSETINSI